MSLFPTSKILQIMTRLKKNKEKKKFQGRVYLVLFHSSLATIEKIRLNFTKPKH